jgi:hypothetical protein
MYVPRSADGKLLIWVQDPAQPVCFLFVVVCLTFWRKEIGDVWGLSIFFSPRIAAISNANRMWFFSVASVKVSD